MYIYIYIYTYNYYIIIEVYLIIITYVATICGNYFTQHIPLHIPRRSPIIVIATSHVIQSVCVEISVKLQLQALNY